jgi:energy-coupling factor transporter ATP-binding protein EcfA2
MDDTDHALFHRTGSHRAQGHAVVMVTGPRQCGKTTLVRDLVGANANSSAWTTTQFWLQRAAIQLGWCALLTEQRLTKYRECPTSSGPSRSQWMMIAGPAGFC